MCDAKKQKLQESGLVEWLVFSELVAMDEDEEGFSQTLFKTFVEQVLDTFAQIKTELKNKNFNAISALGHYLKGSAAALGLLTISTECERIQNYGHKLNFDNFDPICSKTDESRALKSNKGDASDEDDEKKDEDEDEEEGEEKNDELENALQAVFPKENTDEYWVFLIKDALANAVSGFEKSQKALNEYFSTTNE